MDEEEDAPSKARGLRQQSRGVSRTPSDARVSSPSGLGFRICPSHVLPFDADARGVLTTTSLPESGRQWRRPCGIPAVPSALGSSSPLSFDVLLKSSPQSL